MACVYILEINNDKYYIGSTTNIEKRIKHHFGNSTPSTNRLGQFKKLVFKQEYPTLKEARKIESRLKKLKRKDYLKKIIQDGFIKIKPR